MRLLKALIFWWRERRKRIAAQNELKRRMEEGE
jgi:hypothetical protein